MLTKELIDKFYEDVESLQLRFPGKIISKETGFNKGVVSEYLNKKKVPSETFLDKFYDWFNKSSLNVPRETFAEQLHNHKLNKEQKKGIPFYDTEATAGITETDMSPIHAPSGTIDVGDLLHDSQSAIRIYGNSMIPGYPPGCVVGLRKMRFPSITPGEVYVVETADGRMLKRLFYEEGNHKSEYLLLYSDNTKKFDNGPLEGRYCYPPKYLKREEILGLYMVTGVIKRNMNSVIIQRSIE